MGNGNIKWDTQINLQQLIGAVITIVISVVLFGFTLKGEVNITKIQQKSIEEQLDAIQKQLKQNQNTLFQIQLDLKDKADREDG